MGVTGVTGDVEDSEAWSTVSSRSINDSGPVSGRPAVLRMADTQLARIPAVTAERTICFPSHVCKKKITLNINKIQTLVLSGKIVILMRIHTSVSKAYPLVEFGSSTTLDIPLKSITPSISPLCSA